MLEDAFSWRQAMLAGKKRKYSVVEMFDEADALDKIEYDADTFLDPLIDAASSTMEGFTQAKEEMKQYLRAEEAEGQSHVTAAGSDPPGPSLADVFFES